MKRDSVLEIDVKARIKNQLTDSERLTYADFEIKNTTIETAKKDFEKILKFLKKM